MKKRAARISREIVWIDQAPLHRILAAECNMARAQLDEVRIKWHHFERKDRPAFIRWRAREFGALLSESREVEGKIRDARELIHEVERELRSCFQTPQSAYARVMFRRENPGIVEPVSGLGGEGKRILTEFEQEALFQEWVRRLLGTNPDKMDDEAYSASFAAFKAHMFTAQAPSPSPEAEMPRTTAQPVEGPGKETEPDVTVDERVKILYRRLARQLHPDTRGDGSVEVTALWHEVQEAYAAGDVARMELLLALSHLQTKDLENKTSLGELLLVEQELRRALVALTKSVLEAEKEDAWEFARCGPTPQLTSEVERQLKFNLANRTRYLEQLQRLLAEWQKPDSE